jgi:hypothetical protein
MDEQCGGVPATYFTGTLFHRVTARQSFTRAMSNSPLPPSVPLVLPS